MNFLSILFISISTLKIDPHVLEGVQYMSNHNLLNRQVCLLQVKKMYILHSSTFTYYPSLHNVWLQYLFIDRKYIYSSQKDALKLQRHCDLCLNICSAIGVCPASATPSNDCISVVASCLHLSYIPDTWELVGRPWNKRFSDVKFTNTKAGVCVRLGFWESKFTLSGSKCFCRCLSESVPHVWDHIFLYVYPVSVCVRACVRI